MNKLLLTLALLLAISSCDQYFQSEEELHISVKNLRLLYTAETMNNPHWTLAAEDEAFYASDCTQGIYFNDTTTTGGYTVLGGSSPGTELLTSLDWDYIVNDLWDAQGVYDIPTESCTSGDCRYHLTLVNPPTDELACYSEVCGVGVPLVVFTTYRCAFNNHNTNYTASRYTSVAPYNQCTNCPTGSTCFDGQCTTLARSDYYPYTHDEYHYCNFVGDNNFCQFEPWTFQHYCPVSCNRPFLNEGLDKQPASICSSKTETECLDFATYNDCPQHCKKFPDLLDLTQTEIDNFETQINDLRKNAQAENMIPVTYDSDLQDFADYFACHYLESWPSDDRDNLHGYDKLGHITLLVTSISDYVTSLLEFKQLYNRSTNYCNGNYQECQTYTRIVNEDMTGWAIAKCKQEGTGQVVIRNAVVFSASSHVENSGETNVAAPTSPPYCGNCPTSHSYCSEWMCYDSSHTKGTIPTSPSSCSNGKTDKHTECETWRDQGRCTEFRGWYKTECPVSCDSCLDSELCYDSDGTNDSFDCSNAVSADCTADPTFYETICPVLCGICTP